ncbi:hypothetical protein PMAYCL1PPCAC_09624, partial [Pristionchus mayeri]
MFSPTDRISMSNVKRNIEDRSLQANALSHHERREREIARWLLEDPTHTVDNYDHLDEDLKSFQYKGISKGMRVYLSNVPDKLQPTAYITCIMSQWRKKRPLGNNFKL